VVAVDSAASWLAGFDPQELIYLRLAAAAGLGENNPNRLKFYTAMDSELVRCPDPAALRFDPPFRVISGILGEDLDPFPALPTQVQPALQGGDVSNDPIMTTLRSWKEAFPCHSTSENAVN
jgi:hypothetical protein